MGNRKYSFILKLLLGKFFINRKLKDFENTDFIIQKFPFNTRWSEITRRIFESGACGCCIITNKLPKENARKNIYYNESIIFYTNIFSLIKELFSVKDRKRSKNCTKIISNY